MMPGPNLAGAGEMGATLLSFPINALSNRCLPLEDHRRARQPAAPHTVLLRSRADFFAETKLVWDERLLGRELQMSSAAGHS